MKEKIYNATAYFIVGCFFFLVMCFFMWILAGTLGLISNLIMNR
jgi:hypothetical protein